MNTLKEIEIFLLEELLTARNNGIPSSDYYNEFVGDSSILMCSILTEHLLERQDWDVKEWLDDGLITRIIFDEEKFCIWGIIIWGRENTLQQWTSPFYLELDFLESPLNIKNYTFLFGDLESNEVSYEEFSDNRDYWDRDFYADENWQPFERNWEYIIHSKNE